MDEDLFVSQFFQSALGVLGRVIGFLSIPLFIAGFILLIKSIKKSNTLRIRSHLLSIFFSLAMLVVNVVFLNQAIISWWLLVFMLLGFGFGFLWGLTTRMRVENGQVIGKRSVLFMVFWMVSLAVTQLLMTFASRQVVAIGMGTLFFSAGTSLGTNFNLISRIAIKRMVA